MTRVLIVEDEPRIAAFLEKGLSANGFATVLAEDGRTGLELARDGAADLMILDLGLPDFDGHEVLRSLRDSGSRLPVIILTARQGAGEAITSLDGGADDYVTKPFHFGELLARVRARVREMGQTTPEALEAGEVRLDLRTRRASVSGRSVDLSTREFNLAEMLFRHPGQVLSREQLLSHVWGYDFDTGSNVVDVYVGYLRKKLGHGLIETVRGAGYRLIAAV